LRIEAYPASDFNGVLSPQGTYKVHNRVSRLRPGGNVRAIESYQTGDDVMVRARRGDDADTDPLTYELARIVGMACVSAQEEGEDAGDAEDAGRGAGDPEEADADESRAPAKAGEKRKRGEGGGGRAGGPGPGHAKRARRGRSRSSASASASRSASASPAPAAAAAAVAPPLHVVLAVRLRFFDVTPRLHYGNHVFRLAAESDGAWVPPGALRGPVSLPHACDCAPWAQDTGHCYLVPDGEGDEERGPGWTHAPDGFFMLQKSCTHGSRQRAPEAMDEWPW
jgi:hypothetical protein